MEELKIKRCQFCDPTNSDQILFWDDDKNLADDLRHHVVCLNCFAQGPKKSTKQLAIEAWNKRADDWISVDSVRPKKDIIVLLYKKDISNSFFFDQGYLIGNDWFSNNKKLSFIPTHWKPTGRMP
jgi:hypothetical protein